MVAQYARVDDALARYYARHVGEVAGEARVERSIREWFEFELITDTGRRDLARPDTPGSPGDAAVRRLKDAYLIRDMSLARSDEGGSSWPTTA